LATLWTVIHVLLGVTNIWWRWIGMHLASFINAMGSVPGISTCFAANQ